jgi:DNA-binding GntR family transcriptional regulator
VRQQRHKDLKAIVDAIDARNPKRAEELVADHLMHTWRPSASGSEPRSAAIPRAVPSPADFRT